MGGIWGEGYTFKENYVKKLIGYAWKRFKVPEILSMESKVTVPAVIRR
jgi:hypothetical protein